LAILATSIAFALGLGIAPANAQEATAKDEAYTPTGMAKALGSAVEDDDVIDADEPKAEYTGSGMATAIGSNVEASPTDEPEKYTGSGMATAIGSDVEEPAGPDDVPKRLRQAGVENLNTSAIR
jgi:hypothetical protein